jgi:hypothetical protein
MINWILILMIVGDGTNVSPGSPAITSISGFKTHASCADTGDQWVKSKVGLERYYTCISAEDK